MTTLKYPPQAANGKLMLSDNDTAEAILSAIQTRYGERVFRNTYGNDLDVFVVTGDIASLLVELREAIIASTIDYLPLSLAVSGYLDENGNTIITVDYDDDERTKTITVKL